ncbi:MAG: hypothetical protein ACXVED_18995 [Bacteroidia bacterium]
MFLIKNACIVLSTIALLNNFANAQSFNYQLTKDSSAYSNLTEKTTLLQNESFLNKHPSIHLPFTFNFSGSNTDSLIVETNGFLVFDPVKKISLISFNSFSGNKDSSQSFPAAINYNTTGTQGNRIVKIEFRNLSLSGFSYYDNLSYQVWLYESGNVIEYHIGPNYFSTQSELEIPVLMGTINQNMDTDNKAFLITGNPSSPSGQLISGENNLVYINSVPASGIIYRLTPSF